MHFQSVALNIQAKVHAVLRKTIRAEISIGNTFERTRLPWCWAHAVCTRSGLCALVPSGAPPASGESGRGDSVSPRSWEQTRKASLTSEFRFPPVSGFFQVVSLGDCFDSVLDISR